MKMKHTGLIPILLLFCAMVIGGCGWITGGNKAPGTSGDSSSPQSMNAVARAAGIYSITAVTPNQGFLPGGENIFITGIFPAIADAINIYKVYFGGNIAPYVPLVPSFTPTQLNVTAPPGVALGFVNVGLWDTIAGVYCATLANGYEYVTLMELLSIVPDQGPLGVKTPVEVITMLPTVTAPVTDMATAVSMYSVTIGLLDTNDPPNIIEPFVPCVFDINAPVKIRPNADGTVSLFMTTPTGASLGLKDAFLIDESGTEPDVLERGIYEYIGMVVDSIIPNNGPLGSNTQVEIITILPVVVPDVLSDAAGLAYALSVYAVDIDTFACSYDMFFPELIRDNGDGTTSFFMRTPPGASLGFKDVTLIDLDPTPLPDATLVNGYEYTSGAGFGTLTSITVQPNPVGPLKAGELQVRLEVSGSFDPDDFEVFIVPQGGDPEDPAHRITLDIDTGPSTTQVWIGTNASSIETDMFAGEIYPDGHAAVYVSTLGDGVLGMDFSAPYDDGGTFADDAIMGRHFIIDTIPPLMNVVAPIIAVPAFVDIGNVGGYKPGNADTILPPYNLHPYDLPPLIGGPYLNTKEHFPWSTFGGITSIPDTNPAGAQRFINVASISNNNTPLNESLDLVIEVEFFDYDIYSYPLVTYPPATFSDGDLFDGGSPYRAPAGFRNEAFSVPNVLDEDEAILNGSYEDPDTTLRLDLVARWELQGTSTPFPTMTGSFVDFTSTGADIGGFVNTVVLEESKDTMTATWSMPDMQVPDSYMRLVTKFAAGDRADIYYPRGDTSEDIRRIMTPEEVQLDPLQLWWMREVRTDITHDGIPANGVTQNPSFQWEIGTQPRPVLDGDLEVQPLFSYQLWESQGTSSNLEEFRNGVYAPHVAVTWMNPLWSDGWHPHPTNTSFVPPPPGGPAALTPNKWYLLTVMAIDEAGNAEAWPEELDQENPATNLIVTNRIFEVKTNNKGGSNWRRFYYAKDAASVDTKVTFEFWHDANGDTSSAGEKSFGNQTIIPLPPQSKFFPPNGVTLEEVKGLFQAEVIEDIAGGVNPSIAWTLTSNGAAPIFATFDDPPGFGYDNFLLAEQLGDRNRIEPITYVLTATASIVDSFGVTITDPTPVNIRFTVVPDDNVSKYIKNSNSEDNQVLKEYDRQ